MKAAGANHCQMSTPKSIVAVVVPQSGIETTPRALTSEVIVPTLKGIRTRPEARKTTKERQETRCSVLVQKGNAAHSSRERAGDV